MKHPRFKEAQLELIKLWLSNWFLVNIILILTVKLYKLILIESISNIEVKQHPEASEESHFLTTSKISEIEGESSSETPNKKPTLTHSQAIDMIQKRLLWQYLLFSVGYWSVYAILLASGVVENTTLSNSRSVVVFGSTLFSIYESTESTDTLMKELEKQYEILPDKNNNPVT